MKFFKKGCQIRKGYLMILMAFFVCSTYQISTFANMDEVIELSHDIAENIELHSGMTYVLKQDISIKKGVTVVIPENVVLKGQGYKLKNYGTLKMTGVTLFDVNLKGANENYSPYTLEMSKCVMNNGSLLAAGDAGHGYIKLRENRFQGLNDYSYIWYPAAEIYIEKNIFESCKGISIGSDYNAYIRNNVFYKCNPKGYVIKDWAAYKNSMLYVENNSFYDTGTVLKLEYDSGKMSAKNNYWNTTNEALIATRVMDGDTDFSVENRIEYLPVLEQPHENTPIPSFAIPEEEIYVPAEDDGSKITEDTIYEAGQTYSLKKNIDIKNGATLTIPEGAVINGNGYSINIHGGLTVRGATLNNVKIVGCGLQSKPYTLTMYDSSMYGGSLLYPSGNTGSGKITIRGNQFKGLSGYSHIWYPEGRAYIERNTFENCGGISVGSRNNVYIRNNVFNNCNTKGYVIKDWAAYDNSMLYVQYNTFYDTEDVLKLEYTSGKMHASNNYWNTTDESLIKERIIDGTTDSSLKNTIDYLPILTEAHEETPILEHVWSTSSVIKKATCVAEGKRREYCKYCSTYQDLAIPALGHEFEEEWTIDQEATCTEVGSKSHHCIRCEERDEETSIPETGHTWSDGSIVKEATCIEKGELQFTCKTCGEVRTEVIAAVGHEFEEAWTIDQEATCTEAGSKSHHCIRCEEREEETEIPQIEHSWREGVTVKEATCLEEGELQFTCENCEEIKTEVIASLGHEFEEEWTVDQEATCTEAGSKSHHCIRCEEREEETTIPKAGHIWSEGSVVKEATCLEEGELQFTCTVCDEVRTEAIPALDHEFETEWTVDQEATCTEEGSKSHHCIRCEERKEETTIPQVEHSWKEGVTVKEATCLEEGELQFTCEACDKVRAEVIPALGHTFEEEWTVDLEATCTEAGSKSHHCIRCEEREEETVLPQLEHNFSEGVTVKEATCTEEGILQFTCKTCGEVRSKVLAAVGHEFEDEWTIDQQATCTEAGSKSHHCIRCEEREEETTIPQVGHSWSEGITVREATCIEEGTLQFTCKTCGEGRAEAIPALGHEFEEAWTVDQEATCTEAGSKSHHCIRCEEREEETVLPQLEHSWSKGVTVREATCLEEGELQFTCKTCDAEKTEVLAALGHEFEEEWTVDQEATCTEEGSKSHHCTRCEEREEETKIPELDHNWDNGSIIKEPSYIEEGELLYTCDACHAQRNERLPKLKLVDYTITYELFGGENEKTNPGQYNYLTETVILGSPMKKGYTFNGWYTEAEYRNRVTEITTGSEGDITLYASWTPIKYNISYQLAGGTQGVGNPSSYNVESSNISLKKPIKTGYTFAGWYLDQKFQTPIKSISSNATGNYTLYAKWNVNSYQVTYDSNGGRIGTATTKKVTHEYGKNYAAMQNPNRKGYVFAGWYTAKTGGTKVTTSNKVVATKNHVLYARWSAVKVGKPSIQKLSVPKSGQVQVKINVVKQVKGYEVVYSTDSKFKKQVKKVTSSSSQITLKSLQKNKTYYVKVRAYAVDSTNKNVFGLYSSVKKIKVTK